MPIIRRNRGTPVPKEVEKFWNAVKVGLTVTGAVGAASHPAFGLLSIGAEAINQMQGFVASRRSEEFAEDVADDLFEANQDHKLTIEQIQQVIASEQFNSALLQARLIATRTHQEEKLEALRNAILNTALGTEPDDDRQAMFLSLIDRLQPAHLRILKTFQYPPARGSYGQWQPQTIQNPGTPTRWIKEFVSGLKDEDANFIRMLITDLYNTGLAFIAPDAQNMPNDSRLITGLGSGFLTFISEPSK
jgi:hypothetical protein